MRQSMRILMLGAAAAFLVSAQSDPPGRVGRLNYSSGEVSFRPGDVEDWVPAELNRPLTTGDHLWTDEGARASIHIGNASLRLNSRTAFQFLNLDDNAVQIRLAEGSLNIHVRTLAEGEAFEVDTPNTAFTVTRPGEYRVDVNPDNFVSTVIVRAGEGEVTGADQPFAVRSGELARISGNDSLRYDTAGAPRRDEWDEWCEARDRREEQSLSARYVPRDMVGYQDLDDYGDWRSVSDYGPVWVPRRVEAGWAPYHYGRWVWVEPWGWTWVDDSPWGFAPFHYGRWVYVGYWAWVPGPAAVRPVYAPALVAWVGGSRFSTVIAFGGGGGVAWFPLGPREVYVPAYRASRVYINRVNVTNTTIVNNVNITNINTANYRYVNREAPGAVIAVPHTAFAGSRPVQGSAIPVRGDALRSAEVLNTVPVAPSRASVMGGYTGRSVAQPPVAIQERTIVYRRTPPPAPVPFEERQRALSSNPGRPLDASQIQELRSTRPQQERSFNRPAMQQRSQDQAPPQVRPQRDFPTRVERDVQQPRQQQQPPQQPEQQRPQRDFPPRVEREVQQPPPQPVQQPPVQQRPQRDFPPRVEREAQPQRPQREAQPQRDFPPPQRPQREVQQPPPQQPPQQPQQQPQRPERQAQPERPQAERPQRQAQPENQPQRERRRDDRDREKKQL